ncbi:MAG: hypothetical protein IIB95_11470, partial [Candidatus Marinimicrobia bacterium]|nr:hypothetical protein [Candidatus Neomarinimicrobiota bacterium]
MALSDKDFQRLKNKLLQQKEQQVTQQRKKRPFLSRAAEFVGATKLVELAAPAAELFALGGSFLQGESGRRFRQERLLGRPLGEASRVAEEEGLGAGFKVIGGQALETAARASVFTRGGLGTTLIGKGLGGNKLLNFANSFVGRSAEIAFFKSVGEDLQDDTPYGQLFKDASVNALSSAAISFLLGSLGEKI